MKNNKKTKAKNSQKPENKFLNKFAKYFLTLLVAIGLVGATGSAFWYLSPPPKVTGYNEVNIEKTLSFNADFRVVFSSKMNKESTENAFNINPNIDGEFSWENDKVLVFKPTKNLEIGTTYKVSVNTDAKSWLGKKMETTFSQEFIIVGPPQVVFIAPISALEKQKQIKSAAIKKIEDENLDEYPTLKRNQAITVMFDRPIRAAFTPEEDLQDANDRRHNIEDYLIFDPPMEGDYRFLGTSSLQFTPNPDKLPMGNTLEVTLKKGMPSADGGTTEEEIVWHLETEAPAIIKSDPLEMEEFVDPGEAITLTWNQEISTESLFKHLTITPDLPNDVKRTLEVAPGKTENGEQDYSKTLISFKPSFPKDELITVQIEKGVKSLKGEKELNEEYQLHFVTLADPEVRDFYPQNNSSIMPNDTLSVTLSSPVDTDKLKEKLFFEPEVDKEQIKVSRGYSGRSANDKNEKTKVLYEINVPLKAQTEYKWGLLEGIKDKKDQTLEKGFKSILKTKDYPQSMQLMSKGGRRSLYDSDDDIGVFVRSRNVEEIKFKICKLTNSQVAKIEADWGWWDRIECVEEAQEWTEKLANQKNEWVITEVPLYERIDIERGAYYYEFYSPEYTYSWDNSRPVVFHEGLFTANSSITAKTTDEKVLLFVTDFLEGKAIKEIPIAIYGEDGSIVARGETDEKGFFEFKKENRYDRFFAIAENSEYKSYVGSSWDSGISVWDFNLNNDWQYLGHGLGYVFTDRPIYRPGHEVNFKGIVRLDYDADLVVPEDGTAVSVKIESPTSKELFNENIVLSANGTFNGTLNLDESAEVGQYSLIVKYANEEADTDDWFIHTFWVEEYKKPDFKIDITSEKNYFLIGEKFEADIELSRYFGAKMPDTDFDWYVVEEPYFFSKVDGWYSFSNLENYCWWYCETEENVLASGNSKTNEEGKAKISFPINIEEKSPRLLTLRITAEDATARTVTKSETYEAYPDDVLVGIRNDNYYLSGSEDKAEFSVITVDPDGKGIDNQDVEITLYQRKWNSIKKQGVDGAFYWETEEELKELDKKSVITDIDGKATATFKIDKDNPNYSGSIKAIAELGSYKSSDSGYISTNNFVSWSRSNNDRINIRTDKTSYNVGDTANLIIESPFDEPVKALVTIERKNILDYFTEEVSSGRGLKIKVTEDMLPNAYVSVILFKGKGAESAVYKTVKRGEKIEKELDELEEKIKEIENKIEKFEEELEAEDLKENREKLISEAMEKAKEELKNKKIEESSLETEEVAIKKQIEEYEKQDIDMDFDDSESFSPEIKMGIAEIPVNIEEKELEINLKTDKENYLPSEEVKLEIQAINNKREPVANTEITIAVVDESVLALKSRSIGDIVQYFWGRRDIGVQTISSMVFFTERLNVEAQKGEKGGGGGELLSAADLARKKRGEFRDTAYWLPTVVTDENGKAEVSFDLPDNLTTWQILAIASTNDSEFGMSTKNFISKKKLMITPSLPRFAVNGDLFKVGALVHNQTEKSIAIKTSLKTENFELKKNETQSDFLEPGEQKLIEFEGVVSSNSDKYGDFEDIKLNFKTESTVYVDEVEIFIPVNPPAVGESLATSGITEDLTSEFVKIPQVALPNMGNINLTLSALKTGDFTEGLNKLVRYPYGCTEQIMSRHLANVVIKRTEDTIGKQLTGLTEDELKKMVEETMQKIYKLQRSDGGFGFWESSEKSYPQLSAYVYFGLLETKKAGYTIDEDTRRRLENYLKIKLADKFVSDSDKIFMIFMLSEGDKNELALANLFYDNRENLSVFNKICLLLAYQNFSDDDLSGAFEKNAILLSEVEALGKQTDRGVQFASNQNSYYYDYWSSDIRNTAMALLALSREDANHPMIAKITDYLQQSKQRYRYGGPWGTTQNTAWVLISYMEWLEKSGQLNPNFTATAHLNDELFAEKAWTTETRLENETFMENIENLRISPLENEINIKKDGEGKLFYDIVANYYLPSEKVTEKNNGVGVTREFFTFEDKDMETPITKIKQGEIVRGKITIMIPDTRNFLVVDSPLPAGLEAINFNLETEDMGLLDETSQTCGRWWCWWDDLWYFNHKEMRDDRILLFADYVPSGVYEYRFLARAITEGKFQLIPTVAEEMYHPETFGRTDGDWFEVY